MVRRDAEEQEGGKPSSSSEARCTSSAGPKPASVSAGAPSSRPQAGGEIRSVRAGHRKPAGRREPMHREQARGPQHEVKPAASTEKQSGSRAAHFTAKATSAQRAPERVADLGGVLGAARVQGEARNTRDPSALPSSRQGGSYKSKTKSSAAQRECCPSRYFTARLSRSIVTPPAAPLGLQGPPPPASCTSTKRDGWRRA